MERRSRLLTAPQDTMSTLAGAIQDTQESVMLWSDQLGIANGGWYIYNRNKYSNSLFDVSNNQYNPIASNQLNSVCYIREPWKEGMKHAIHPLDVRLNEPVYMNYRVPGIRYCLAPKGAESIRTLNDGNRHDLQSVDSRNTIGTVDKWDRNYTWPEDQYTALFTDTSIPDYLQGLIQN